MTIIKDTQTNKPAIGRSQIALLEKLSNASGVSGDEGEVRAIILEEIKSHVDETKIDALGNLLVLRKARMDNPLRVMLAAHMDEVGLMIVAGDDGGIFEFERVGSVDIRQLVGKQVLVGKNHIPGVIGARPIHLLEEEDMKKTIPIDNLRIDLGLNSSDKAKPGDRVVFGTRFSQVGPSLFGKALDNRMGVTTLIELVKHAPANIEMLAVFTVQEEIGGRGARVSAYGYNPDLAIVLDTTPANDLPTWDDTENAHYNTVLGKGPAIYIADKGTIYDRRLINFFAEIGISNKIPYQIRQPGGGGTDAGQIHRQRSGIPSVAISVPHRNTHSAISIARLADWKNTLGLVYNGLLKLEPALLKHTDSQY